MSKHNDRFAGGPTTHAKIDLTSPKQVQLDIVRHTYGFAHNSLAFESTSEACNYTIAASQRISVELSAKVE